MYPHGVGEYSSSCAHLAAAQAFPQEPRELFVNLALCMYLFIFGSVTSYKRGCGPPVRYLGFPEESCHFTRTTSAAGEVRGGVACRPKTAGSYVFGTPLVYNSDKEAYARPRTSIEKGSASRRIVRVTRSSNLLRICGSSQADGFRTYFHLCAEEKTDHPVHLGKQGG